MNLLPATVGGGGETLDGAGFSLPLPAAWRQRRVAPGRSLLVGIRPEHLLLAAEQPAGPSAAIEVELEVLETLGHQSLAHARRRPGAAGGDPRAGELPARGSDPCELQVPLAARPPLRRREQRPAGGVACCPRNAGDWRPAPRRSGASRPRSHPSLRAAKRRRNLDLAASRSLRFARDDAFVDASGLRP